MGVRLCVLCLLILLNCMLCYKAVWGENGLIDHGALKEQQLAAEEECKKLDEANRTLSREIRLLQTDDSYMEKKAPCRGGRGRGSLQGPWRGSCQTPHLS